MFSELYLIFTSFLVTLQVHQNFGQMFSNDLAIMEWAVHCKLQANGYDCARNHTTVSRFYYDIKMQSCRTFRYNHCGDMIRNNFYSLLDCNEQCRDAGHIQIADQNITASLYCLLQPDFGACGSYFPMWYFDVTSRHCKGFSYSGCGGNRNRFTSSHKCNAVCGHAVPYPKEKNQDKYI